MKTIYVKRREFLEWFYDDEHTPHWEDTILYQLTHYGKASFEIDMPGIIPHIGYLPLQHVTNPDDADAHDRQEGEIEDLSKYKIEFVDPRQGTIE